MASQPHMSGPRAVPIMRGMSDALPGQVEVLATDPRDPDTLYAGTVDGTVLIGSSRGDSWSVLAQDLPPVHSFAFAS